MYWNIDTPLQFNKLLNFIVGARGVGKTYGTTKRAIDNFITNGTEFIYLRRQKEELKVSAKKIFKALLANGEYPDAELKIAGDTLMYNGEVMGYVAALSDGGKYKSIAYPNVTDIIFDEFIPDERTGYLKGEITTFLDFYETVARMRDVRVWFLSNALTITNQYFTYFGLHPRADKEFTLKEDILVQTVKSEEYGNEKKKTRIGKILQGTEYASYAYDNNYLYDNTDFIEKKSGKSSFNFAVSWKGKTFGIWNDYSSGKVYVSYNVQPNSDFFFCLSTDDMQPNYILLKQKQPKLLKQFFNQFSAGVVRFETLEIKNLFMDMIRRSL